MHLIVFDNMQNKVNLTLDIGGLLNDPIDWNNKSVLSLEQTKEI